MNLEQYEAFCARDDVLVFSDGAMPTTLVATHQAIDLCEECSMPVALFSGSEPVQVNISKEALTQALGSYWSAWGARGRRSKIRLYSDGSLRVVPLSFNI